MVMTLYGSKMENFTQHTVVSSLLMCLHALGHLTIEQKGSNHLNS